MKPLWLTLVFFVLSCSDASNDHQCDGHSDCDQQECYRVSEDEKFGVCRDFRTCVGVSEDECVANPICYPIIGQTLDSTNICSVPTYAGCKTCITVDDCGNCNNADGFRLAPETGQCFRFSNLCIPDDWPDRNWSVPQCIDELADTPRCEQ